MKKHFIKIGIAASILSIAAINVHLNSNNESGDVTLSEVEALAGESNPWYLWPSQGTTKDEYPVTKECTESINLLVWTVEWKGTRTICRDGGSENCSTIICEE